MKRIALGLLLASLVCTAEDITTTDGRIYKNATVVRADAARATIKHAEGVATVPIALMPAVWQQRLHYNPQTAASLVQAEKTVAAKRAAAQAHAQAIAAAAKNGWGKVLYVSNDGLVLDEFDFRQFTRVFLVGHSKQSEFVEGNSVAFRYIPDGRYTNPTLLGVGTTILKCRYVGEQTP